MSQCVICFCVGGLPKSKSQELQWFIISVDGEKGEKNTKYNVSSLWREKRVKRKNVI